MPDPPGGAARLLTRNAVDALPEGELGRQLARGAAAAREARRGPHHAGHPPGPHGGAAQAARVSGPRPHRRADHRRLHRARGGPERPLARPARRGLREEIDRNAETYQEQAFKVLDRERTEVRRNGEWLDMAMEDLFRLARTATVAQLLERDDFAKRYRPGEPISILELLYPLLQGYDSVAIALGRGARRHRPEVQHPARAGHPAGLRRRRRSPSSRCRSCRGSTACRRCRSRSATTWASPSPPEEVFGKLMRVPDDAMPIYYELLLDEPWTRARPRATRSAAWPGRSPSASTARRPRARREAHFDRLHVEHEPAGRRRGARLRGRQRRGPPAGAARRRLRALALRGAPAAGPGRGQARRRADRRRTHGPAGRAARRRRAPGRAPALQAAPASAEVACLDALSSEPSLRCYTAPSRSAASRNHRPARARGL